jgi:hypothetical protein
MINKDDLRLSESEMNMIGEAKQEQLEAFSELAQIEITYARQKKNALEAAERADQRHSDIVESVVKMHGLAPHLYDVDFGTGKLVQTLAGVFDVDGDNEASPEFEQAMKDDMDRGRGGCVTVRSTTGVADEEM